ncbi:MAG: glycosyltransferase, partial [Anaerolineales bacterium]
GKEKPLSYLGAWRRLRRSYSLDQFDLIHAQFGQSGLLAMPTRKPLIVTFHGSDLQGFLSPNGNYSYFSRYLLRISQFVAKRADQAIIVSDHLRDYLPPEISPEIIPCGVDLELFRPIPQTEARKRLSLPLDKSLVLFAADPKRTVKRFQLAEKSVQLVKSRLDVELIVISGIPHDEVPLYMNACDALILTSHHEGSPTVVKEALACNLPIVSVDVGDVRERIVGIEGCLLCYDDSPEAIADRIAHVLEASTRVPGREAVADLDERINAQKIISVYRQVLRNRQIAFHPADISSKTVS